MVDSPRPPIRRDLAGNPRPCNLPSAEGGLHRGGRERAREREKEGERESLLIPVGEELGERRMARVSRRQGYDSDGEDGFFSARSALCLRLRLCHCLYLCPLPSVFVFRGKRLENGELNLERLEKWRRRMEGRGTIFIDSSNNRTTLFHLAYFVLLNDYSWPRRERERKKERENGK